MENKKLRFRRILLKLSGEVFVGKRAFGIDPSVLKSVSEEIHGIHRDGVEVAVVIGGGNIFRGLDASEYGIGRVPADYMGMLATVINAIALGEALRNLGSETRIMSAIDMNKVVEPLIVDRAVHHLERKRIVLFGAGTGSPFFSTDTAAALRALEIQAEVLLKATKVEGVFESDPEKTEKNSLSKPFRRLTFKEVLEKDLRVMDMTAVSLAMEKNLPIIVFDLKKKGNIRKVVSGRDIGTLITGEKQ